MFETSAEVQQAEESEIELVERARTAESDAAWIVGECASLWTQRYARGRTDAAFAEAIGANPESVAQRRRVYDLFGDARKSYPGMTFSHFRAAISWPDAPDCLAWAVENEASWKEMAAWRRMQHGEDLTVEPDAEPAVEPCGKPQSAVVSPAESAESAESGTRSPPTEPPAKPDETSRKVTKPPETPEPHLTLTDIRRLLVAAENTSGDVRESRKLAAWHRKRADELDPITSKGKPGSLDEVAAYVAENSYRVDPERWWDHYEANGWKVGRNPLRDWKASIRTAHKEGWAAPEGQQKQQDINGSLDRFLERRGLSK